MSQEEPKKRADGEPLICVESGAESAADARGWRVYLDSDGDLVTYCPECAEREFGEP